MNSQDPFSDSEKDPYRHEAPYSGLEDSSSLNLAQRALLNLPVTILAFCISIPAYLLLAFFWAIILLVQVPRPLEGLEEDLVIGGGLLGLLFALTLWGVVAFWRLVKHDLMTFFDALLSPPLGRYFVTTLILFMMMKGISTPEYAAPHPFYTGLFVGFGALLPFIAFPRVMEWTFDLSQWIYRQGSKSPYRAGALTVVSSSILLCMGLPFCAPPEEKEKMLEEFRVAFAPNEEAEEKEAQYMGIYSGGNWTEEDEIIARRLEECFQLLGPENQRFIAKSRWISYPHLHTVEDAEDAVSATTMKVCESHSKAPKENLIPYFQQSLRNTMRDYNRKSYRAQCILHIELEETRGITIPRPDDETFRRARMQRVNSAFCKLNENQQIAVKYSALGEDHNQLAARLNTSPANARQLVSRGRQKMQIKLRP